MWKHNETSFYCFQAVLEEIHMKNFLTDMANLEVIVRHTCHISTLSLYIEFETTAIVLEFTKNTQFVRENVSYRCIYIVYETPAHTGV